MGKHCVGETHYEEDVFFIIDSGFDGVKIDNCGASHNVTKWAELFNASGKPIRIESCHTFHINHGTPSSWPNFPVCFITKSTFSSRKSGFLNSQSGFFNRKSGVFY